MSSRLLSPKTIACGASSGTGKIFRGGVVPSKLPRKRFRIDRRDRSHRRPQFPPRPGGSIYLPAPLGPVPPGEHSSRWWAGRKKAAFARLPVALQDMVRAGRWLDSIEPWQIERFDLGWRRAWDAYLEAVRMGAAPDRKVELKRLAARRYRLRGQLPPRFQKEQDFEAMRAAGHGRIADELEALYRRAQELHLERPLPDVSTARAQDLNTMRHRRIRYQRRYRQEGGEFSAAAKARWQPILDELESIIREREAEEYDAREREYLTAVREAKRGGVICLAEAPRRPGWMVLEDHAQDEEERAERALRHQENWGRLVELRIERAKDTPVVHLQTARERARQERTLANRARAKANRQSNKLEHLIRKVLDWAWGAGRVAPGSQGVLVPVGGETWIAYPDGAIAWQTQRARAIEAVGVRFDGGWAFPPVGVAAQEAVALATSASSQVAVSR